MGIITDPTIDADPHLTWPGGAVVTPGAAVGGLAVVAPAAAVVAAGAAVGGFAVVAPAAAVVAPGAAVGGLAVVAWFGACASAYKIPLNPFNWQE